MLLPTRMVEKPWGRDALPAPFVAPDGKRIGEIWFEPPPELDALLIKYLFTSEKLSVQVHPGGPDGKEECWLVVAAEPGAALGIGFKQAIAPEAMRAAALDGSIQHLLAWHPVAAGDFFYIPGGTVHAIGAGVSLIEVQQNHDLTYRLYDYDRPRELHLEQGIAVARAGQHDASLRRHVADRGLAKLVDGPFFRLDRADGELPKTLKERYSGPLLVVPLCGRITVGGERVVPGQCALAQAIADVAVADDARCLLAQPCGPGNKMT